MLIIYDVMNNDGGYWFFKWRIMKLYKYIYDNRFPKGCRVFRCCMTCPAYCGWRKIIWRAYRLYDLKQKK